MDNDNLPQNNNSKKNKRKINLEILYWSAAFALLIFLIFLVLYITAPSEKTAPPPDLSATLEKALAEALGPPTDTPIPSQTQPPTQTPTASRTPLPTLTATTTQTPTPTFTSSAIPPPPTLTPALPDNIDEAFELVALPPSEFDYTISMLEGFPDLLPNGIQNEDFYTSFYHAMVMRSEALLKYPNDPKAIDWRWGLAYNLSEVGDDRAGITYASLLTQEISENDLSLESLGGLVEERDSRLNLSINGVSLYQENISNHLIEIQTEGGSIFLWHTEDPEGNAVFPLSDESNYQNPSASKVFWSDLTNDQNKELIIFTPGPESRDFSFPTVFDLSQTPPKILSFKPNQDFEIGLENEYDWNIISNNQGFYDLQLRSTVYPPCPVNITHTYQWTGRWLERVNETYQVQPVTQLLQYCELLVDQASNVWSLPAAIQIMETILPEWPPESTVEKTYPLDAYDELRYRLGVYHALSGDIQNSKAYFEAIIQTPVVPVSRWVSPANEFLSELDIPAGIYRVCVNSDPCDNRIALQNWVSTISSQEAVNALNYLSSGGVSIRYTNIFDFEDDGQPERWFTIRHTYVDRLEFWILSETDDGAQLLYVDTVDTNQPNLTRYTNLNGQTYVWIGSQQSFRLVRYPDSSEASISLLPPSYYYADLTNQIAESSLQALLSGFSADNILDDLLAHRDSSTFICMNKEECARFYYALGFAAEQVGDEVLAVESYLKIWWDSFESPFSTIVRKKLAYKPGYGPIATATPIPTITPSLTPSRTPTLTYTPSPTLTGSLTITITQTPTVTFTEDPNMTYTPTPSTTPTPTVTNTTDPYPRP
jgi:hypothetical protein